MINPKNAWVDRSSVPQWVLDAIGWYKYVQSSSITFPEHLINTKKNRACNKRHVKKINKLKRRTKNE